MSLLQRLKAAWAILRGDTVSLIKHVESLGMHVSPRALTQMGDGGPGETRP